MIPSSYRKIKENNDLMKLLRKFPYENWYYYWLSSNKNMTLDYIKENHEKHWAWPYILCNPYIITWEKFLENFSLFEKYITKGNISRYLCQNPNITWDIIKNNKYFSKKYFL